MLKEHLAYLKDNPHGYWFKAKLYGWGWVPARWQGWTTIAVFIGLISLNAFRLEAQSLSEDAFVMRFIPQTILLVLILIAICWRTGERPHWQWGPPKK